MNCEHTLLHEDPNGKPQGSWVKRDGENGVRIECSKCGKFYGYSPGEESQAETKPETTETANWLESLDEPTREAVFEEMRRLREKSDQHLERAREMAPRGGEIAAGSEHTRAEARGDALARFLGELGKGQTPDEALATAKDLARTWAENWNRRREHQVHIADMFADTELETAWRGILQAAKPFIPEPDEEPTTGRSDYEERRDARIERYRERADKARSDAQATEQHARQMADVIPLGQPILVGHHSERADRNYRDRIGRTFRKASELSSKASHYDQKAAAAEANTSVSSDDPGAVGKLEEKLKALEALQERMKAINAAWRKAKKPTPDDQEAWQRIADAVGVKFEHLGKLRLEMARHQGWNGDDTPYPGYKLRNNNGEIRRLRKRIEELAQTADLETSEVDHGFVTVVENAEENRIQLVFPGKPPEDVRKTLKSWGFRWSRTNGAWQRHLNNAGRAAAQAVVKQLGAEKPVA